MTNTQTPWPAGVSARYATVGGATVDLKTDDSFPGHLDGSCTGCGARIAWGNGDAVRRDAQRHAETCRAMPRTAAN